MKNILIVLAIGCISFMSSAQQPEFDKLEMLFAQKHYKKVNRSAKMLLDDPTYDYSMIPTYYLSMSMLQLAQNDHWLKKHPEVINEAVELFLKVKKSTNGEQLFNAHMYELNWIKSDLISWASDLKRAGNTQAFKQVQNALKKMYEGIPDMEIPDQNAIVDSVIVVKEPDVVAEEATISREEIVETAKQYLGTPYAWAGSSPNGFDCSGYTCFIMKNFGKELSRRSEDQFNDGKKVKAKNVEKGDLVFFSNGSGISHVGIVVSEKGQPIVMIHSSSSKGVIMTEIESSEYWMKRLHGFATYVY